MSNQSFCELSVPINDSRTKPLYEVGNDLGQILDDRRSANHNLFSRKEDTTFYSMQNGNSTPVGWSLPHASVLHNSESMGMGTVTGLSSQDVINATNAFGECSTNTKKRTFFLDDGGIEGSCDDKKCSRFSPADISPFRISPDILENKQCDSGNNFLYENFPDVHTFTELDKMFSNGSTYGQESLITADDFSWFSSSTHGAYGTKVASGLGLHSSLSELSAFNSTSEYHCPNSNLLEKDCITVADYDNSSNCGYELCALDTHAERESALEEQVFNPYAQLEDFLPLDEVLFTHTTSPKSEVGTNPSSTSDISAHVTSYEPPCVLGSSEQSSVLPVMRQETNVEEVFSHKRYHESNVELPQVNAVLADFEMDSPKLGESSSLTSAFYDEISCYQQLQNVMEQLDTTTKQGLRDGLCRLAKSSQQSHFSTNLRVGIRVSEIAAGVRDIEELKECMEFIGEEMFRDPIDQSMIQLLFMPSGYATNRAGNFASSAASPVVHLPWQL